MKSRLTAWLTGLLLISAVFGVPVTRVATNRVACYQVYCEQREDDRAEQVPEVSRPVQRPRPEDAALPDSFATRLLDHSLFQRPPPSSSL